ncbi:DUF6879 family protein [Actinacidiphila bryophytorum]|uniref:DUF6879 family protein n=1 Tax=Actinacidiphila bryophytorum TaxID=1436133 RepID=UPI0021769711|nr:DUF6879 family protein [Actinacidiphila bryophytorum]UWE12231.1 hypothetical protein NYE86_28445 [Actinacidiphila bryophytorum]
MLDLLAPALPEGTGRRLGADDYRRDFRERRGAIRDGNSWKLERRQHFEEAGSPSRDALRRGNWPEALRLFEAERPAVRAAAVEEDRRGSAFHRLRVVEEPLTPYMQWELHWLALRAECGHRVRVLPATSVEKSEARGLLPELTLLDGRTLYRVLYDAPGATLGAIRYTDPATVAPWTAYLRHAYESAEDVLSYFTRVVQPLPPPPPA